MVEGLWFVVYVLWSRGLMVRGLWFRGLLSHATVEGSGFGVEGSGFRVVGVEVEVLSR